MKSHSPIIAAEFEHYDKNGKLVRKFNNNDFVDEFELCLTVKDTDGNIVRTHKQPFKTFTKNFAHFYNDLLFGVNNATLLRTTANAAPSARCQAGTVLAASTDDTYGIVAGLNTDNPLLPSIGATVGADDYTLRNKIAHNAAGLAYGATTLVTYTGTILQFTRSFVNASASTIVVKEFGLITKSNTADYVMMCRDTVDAGGITALSISVAAGQTLTVTYNFSVTSLTGNQYSAATFTNNYLNMIKSVLSASAETFLLTDGTTASVNYSSNPSYHLCTAPASTTDYGILAGMKNQTVNFGPTLAFLGTQVTTDLDHSAHTVEALSSESAIVVATRPPNAGAGIGVSCTKIGVSRSLKNTGTSNILLNQAALCVAGSGSNNRSMIMAVNFVTPGATEFTLGPQETLKIKMYILYPYYTGAQV